MQIKGRPQSSNIIEQIMQTIGPAAVAPPPRMGEGDYLSTEGPAGWDYDTLLPVMEAVGENIDDWPEAVQSQVMDDLEAAGIRSEKDAINYLKKHPAFNPQHDGD